MIRIAVEVELLADRRKKIRVFRHSPVFIGRGEEADLRIDVPALSSIHGRVDATAGGFEYIDLSSRNGSSLDGRRLAEDVTVGLKPESALILADVARIRVYAGSTTNAGGDLDSVLRWEDHADLSGDGPTVDRALGDLLGALQVSDDATVEPGTLLLQATANSRAESTPDALSAHSLDAPMTSPERTALLPPGWIAQSAGGSLEEVEGILIGAAGGTRILDEPRADENRFVGANVLPRRTRPPTKSPIVGENHSAGTAKSPSRLARAWVCFLAGLATVGRTYQHWRRKLSQPRGARSLVGVAAWKRNKPTITPQRQPR